MGDVRNINEDTETWCSPCLAWLLHRFRPSPESGPWWRCCQCGAANGLISKTAAPAPPEEYTTNTEGE